MPEDWTDRLLDGWRKARPSLSLEPYEVTSRVARLALHITRSQEEVFGRFGLNRGEIGVLSILRTAGRDRPVSPTQLFRGLMLSSAGITNRLDRLEERGLVRRSPDPHDRRGVLVELTPEGRDIVDRAVAANTKREADLLEGLSSEEVIQLRGLLKKVLSNLE